ncbi:MAG: ribosome silencing factor [Clostridia bacterium]|nr:ribosome silencing factor [Clostridia bacterium]
MKSEEILKLAAKALDDKKAENISAVKIEELSPLAEYFLIATATSNTHVRALTDEVEEVLLEAGEKPHHIEGKSSGWIVLDYRAVIVHIFTPEQREFYDLDRMWSDGESIDLKSILDDNGDE